MTKLFRPTAPARVSTECLPILLTAERNWLARVAVAASVFVLALVTAISYRQDIKIAAAQTRETVVIAAASFSAHFSAVKTGPVATFADPEQMVPVKTPGLTNRDVTNATAVLARPTPTIETQAGASASRARARQAWVPIRSRIERAESPEVESTGGIVIVVQPRDGLRQICLRHFGSYNERLVKEISKLNPELTDPDRIDIGQRIVLPQFGGDRLHVPRSSVITKP